MTGCSWVWDSLFPFGLFVLLNFNNKLTVDTFTTRKYNVHKNKTESDKFSYKAFKHNQDAKSG